MASHKETYRVSCTGIHLLQGNFKGFFSRHSQEPDFSGRQSRLLDLPVSQYDAWLSSNCSKQQVIERTSPRKKIALK